MKLKELLPILPKYSDGAYDVSINIPVVRPNQVLFEEHTLNYALREMPEILEREVKEIVAGKLCYGGNFDQSLQIYFY